MKLSVRLHNREIVDARFADLHESVRSEFPKFIPIGSKPLVAGIVELVFEFNGNVMVCETPEGLF